MPKLCSFAATFKHKQNLPAKRNRSNLHQHTHHGFVCKKCNCFVCVACVKLVLNKVDSISKIDETATPYLKHWRSVLSIKPNEVVLLSPTESHCCFLKTTFADRQSAQSNRNGNRNSRKARQARHRQMTQAMIHQQDTSLTDVAGGFDIPASNSVRLSSKRFPGVHVLAEQITVPEPAIVHSVIDPSTAHTLKQNLVKANMHLCTSSNPQVDFHLNMPFTHPITAHITKLTVRITMLPFDAATNAATERGTITAPHILKQRTYFMSDTQVLADRESNGTDIWLALIPPANPQAAFRLTATLPMFDFADKLSNDELDEMATFCFSKANKDCLNTRRRGGANGNISNISWPAMHKFFLRTTSAPRPMHAVAIIMLEFKFWMCYLNDNDQFQEVEHSYPSFNGCLQLNSLSKLVSIPPATFHAMTMIVESKLHVHMVCSAINETVKAQGWASLSQGKMPSNHHRRQIAIDAAILQDEANQTVHAAYADDPLNYPIALAFFFLTANGRSSGMHANPH